MAKVAILGASGGIGQALAREYATKGSFLYLAGRSDQLTLIADFCRFKGATVETSRFDVRQKRELERWVDLITSNGDLDILVLCVGVSASVYKKEERWFPERMSDLSRELEVNSNAPILCANLCATRMLEKKSANHHFQIGLVSSLLALVGHPSSPGYSASKSALRIFGRALRKTLQNQGIGVTLVLPGFVESPMSRRYQGNKKGILSATDAARRIKKALEQNVCECAFPYYLSIGLRILGLLPEDLQQKLLEPWLFTVVPDTESQRNCLEES